MLYFLQQRMVAARAAVSPTMSAAQQKLMQYLPVVFAVFQVFFLAGLIIYYMAQAVLRIAQQAYITRRFYGHDEALGRQAQRASESARGSPRPTRTPAVTGAAAKKGGFFAQAHEQATATRQPAAKPAPPRRRAAPPILERHDEAHHGPEGPSDPDRQVRWRGRLRTVQVGPGPRAPARSGAENSRDAAAAGRRPRR